MRFYLGIVLGTLFLAGVSEADWEYSENVDPFTDKDTSFIAPGANSDFEGDMAAVPSLKCMYGGLRMVINHDFMVGQDHEVLVTIRVDKNETYGPELWVLMGGSEKNRTSMSPKEIRKSRDDALENLVKQMRSGDRMVIKVTDPYRDSSISNVSLSGFASAFDNLSCMN